MDPKSGLIQQILAQLFQALGISGMGQAGGVLGAPTGQPVPTGAPQPGNLPPFAANAGVGNVTPETQTGKFQGPPNWNPQQGSMHFYGFNPQGVPVGGPGEQARPGSTGSNREFLNFIGQSGQSGNLYQYTPEQQAIIAKRRAMSGR